MREEYKITNRVLLTQGGIVLGITISLFIVHGALHMEPRIAAMIGASLLMLISCLSLLSCVRYGSWWWKCGGYGDYAARLVFVYAVDTDFVRGGITSGSSVEDSLEHAGSHILKAVEDIAAAQGVTPKKVLRKGPVLEVIKQVISEEKADLLILGHEDRTFFEKMLLRGDVEDHVQELTNETWVEVKIVREEEIGDLSRLEEKPC